MKIIEIKHPKLKKEIKEKWLKELRSGKYVQGTEYLKTVYPDGARYCCLGILTDIYLEENKRGWIRPDSSDGTGTCSIKSTNNLSRNECLPSSEVNEWALDESYDGTGEPWAYRMSDESIAPKSWSLWNDNDHGNKSFSEIADIIELYY